MTDVEFPIHDVLIIGAGPCGLAVAARLRESTPSALFTESEHQKFYFMKASSSRQNPKTNSKVQNKPIRTSRRARTSPDRLLPGHDVSNHELDIAVLDANGDQWMSSWNEKFENLGITHLRSPMFFHPDPRDRNGMLEFAVREGRQGELKEISGVVGKELSKHQRKKKMKDGNKRPQETTYVDERDRHDYFRPSQALFKDYCTSIVGRYDLADLVQKAEVTSITYSTTSSLFTLQTSTGIKKARIVVLAIGAATKPSLPPDCPFCTLPPNESVRHVFSKSKSKDKNTTSPLPTILPPSLLSKAHLNIPTSIAIIGGGLTSAQIAHLASLHSITQTHLILRGPLKTKHFDVDLCWLAKFKNHSMSEFWKADSDVERAEMMKAARGGGSVNPEYRRILADLVREGKVVIWEYREVRGAVREDGEGRWRLELVGRKEGMREEILVDHVIYATGAVADINCVEALKPLMQAHPIETVGGMPCLTKELMWNEDIPFFVTGRLGGLRLGPGAPNLEGTRVGAEFIAGKIASLISGLDRNLAEELSDEVDMRRLGLGRQNQFDVLKLDGAD
ncbi:hypothetical protein BKA65DRAFT_391319 [Rhexocercosporidium sp. MPI-PUGE-AT-0058]|nr:hypothetical protein BKA65DRAFT_391319 [Rhexocercosporidium sp. MPI-PUGE-AT-0058]